jgi:hypothetical protein
VFSYKLRIAERLLASQKGSHSMKCQNSEKVLGLNPGRCQFSNSEVKHDGRPVPR